MSAQLTQHRVYEPPKIKLPGKLEGFVLEFISGPDVLSAKPGYVLDRFKVETEQPFTFGFTFGPEVLMSFTTQSGAERVKTCLEEINIVTKVVQL